MLFLFDTVSTVKGLYYLLLNVLKQQIMTYVLHKRWRSDKKLINYTFKKPYLYFWHNNNKRTSADATGGGLGFYGYLK